MGTSITPTDFFTKLTEENGVLKQIQDAYSVTIHKAFEIWSVYMIEQLDSWETAYNYCIGGPDDKDVDAFISELDDDRTIRIIQCKFHESVGVQEERKTLLTLKETMNWLSDENLSDKVKNEDLIIAGQSYRDLIKRNYEVRLKLVTLGELSPSAAEQLKKINEDFSVNTKMEVYTLEDLCNLYEESLSIQDLDPLKAVVEINIIKEQSFIRLKPSIEETDREVAAVVATINAVDLAKLFEDYKYKLFHQNVRYYKGQNTEPAKNMYKTVENPKESNNFWYYNNGISLVCSKIDCETDEDKLITNNIIKVHNPQIINGCQTTVSLSKIKDKLKSLGDAQVLIKIIATENEEISANICEYTNTQNSVSKRDLRSNDLIQKTLKNHFAHLKIDGKSRSFYYLTKKGEEEIVKRFSKVTKAQFKWKYCGEAKASIKYINNEDVAKAYFSFKGYPGSARTAPGKLFKKQGGFYDEIFQPGITVEEYLLPTLMFYKIKEKITALIKDLNSKLNKPGTSDATKRNIQYRIPIKLAPTYCVALMALILKKKYTSIGMKECSKILADIFKSDDILNKLYDYCEETIAQYVRVMTFQGQIVDFSNKFKENETLDDLEVLLDDILEKENEDYSFLPDVEL